MEKRKGKQSEKVGVAIADQAGIGKYQQSPRKSRLTGRQACHLDQMTGVSFCVSELADPGRGQSTFWLSLPFIIIHKVVLDAQLLKELAFQQYFYP